MQDLTIPEEGEKSDAGKSACLELAAVKSHLIRVFRNKRSTKNAHFYYVVIFGLSWKIFSLMNFLRTDTILKFFDEYCWLANVA